MSWEKFQEDAYKLTQQEVKKLSRVVKQNYRDAIKSIDEQLKEVYAKILSDVSPDNYYNEMIKRDRLENLLKQIKKDYNKSSLLAANNIKKAISLSFSNTYYRKVYASQWLVEKNVFGLLPQKLINLTVLGTNEAWKNITQAIKNKYGSMTLYTPQQGTLSSLLVKNRSQEIRKIQSAIVQRLIGGKSYSETTNAIRDIIGREFKDGRVTGSKANALRIIRTETNRTQNAGSYAASKNLQDNGIEAKRRVIATLDNVTRAQSVYTEMHNKSIGIDEAIKYPGGVTAIIPGTTGEAKYDINDRESVIDLIGDFEPSIRIGRNPVTGKNEYFEYKDFDTWAKDNGLTKNIYGEVIAK